MQRSCVVWKKIENFFQLLFLFLFLFLLFYTGRSSKIRKCMNTVGKKFLKNSSVILHQNPLNTSSPPQQSTMSNDDATSCVVWKKNWKFFSTFVSSWFIVGTLEQILYVYHRRKIPEKFINYMAPKSIELIVHLQPRSSVSASGSPLSFRSVRRVFSIDHTKALYTINLYMLSFTMAGAGV